MPEQSYTFFKTLLFCLLFFPAHLLFGQIEVEPAITPPFDPQSLIENIFLGKGIKVINVEFSGNPKAVGYFSNGKNDLNIDNGLVMSTGKVFNIPSANDSPGQTDDNGTDINDPQLASIASDALHDAVIYEIEFVPESDSLIFNYVFASEEYPEFGCNCFNDVFGFFIQGPNFTGWENLALVPGTTDPVSVRTIHPEDEDGSSGGCTNGNLADCGPVNAHLYNDNSGSTTFYFDGYTTVLSARAKVVPCQTYKIKLGITDVFDANYDSAIFFEGKSFGTNVLEVAPPTVHIDQTIAEGCKKGNIDFSIPKALDTDLRIDFEIIGTAQNGIDYANIANNITIPAGETNTTLVIDAIEDQTAEPTETIGIIIGNNDCSKDTTWTFIKDNTLVAPNLGADQNICEGEMVQLDGNLDFLLPDDNRTFSNRNLTEIAVVVGNSADPVNTIPTIIPLTVEDIAPPILNAGLIQSVCVQILTQQTDQIDLFLQSPSGQIIELATDVGGQGSNFSTTCFTPTATTSITEGTAPFDGDFLPEESWDVLFNGTATTNGEWKLFVKDDESGLTSRITNFSITFNPSYQITYYWESGNNISCLDCPDPIVNPIQHTDYILKATDSYGCTASDSLTINVFYELTAPVIACGESTANSVTFNWGAVPKADGYEVNINNTGWQSPNEGLLAHKVSNLSPGEQVDIQVRGISNNNCKVAIAEGTCNALNCIAPTPSVVEEKATRCKGEASGSVLLSSDLAGTVYVLGTDTSTNGVFIDLAVGTYTVKAFDPNKMCSNTIDITIPEPDEITINVKEVKNLSCFESNDGLIHLEVEGGTAPYTYNWTNANIDLDTNVLVNIPAGDYFLILNDANACSETQFIPILQPEKIDVSLNSTGESCFGKEDGTAAITLNSPQQNLNIQWSTLQSGLAVNNLPAGDHSVTVTNSNNCGDTIDFSIATVPAIELSSSITEASCSGKNDGTATVVALGGAGSFTYQWNDPLNQTTATANQLDVRDYQVIATDATGCSDSLVVSITSPNAIQIDTAITDATCFGATDGQVNLIINGGTPNYTLNWSDIGNSNDTNRDDLGAGDYEVTVTDANACSKQIAFTIEAPDSIRIAFNPQKANCGAADGSIEVIATGSNGNFAYQWNDAQRQTTATATNLLKNEYTVIVTDQMGCMKAASIQLEEEVGIELITGATPVLCEGQSTGTATVLATGGSGNYVYLWDDPDAQETPTATNLAAGDYMILVLDGSGCEKSIPVTVPDQSNPMTINFNKKDISCFGQQDASIKASIMGGNPTFTYQWSNNLTNSDLNNLSKGTYILTVTDGNGCQVIDSTTVTEPESFQAEVFTQPISCPENKDAQIEIMPIGGTPPFEYSIDGIRFSPTNQFGNLGPNLYSPTIRDANNCTFPLEDIKIEAARQLIIELEDFNLKAGDSTEIKPVFHNTNGQLSYEWTGNNLKDLSCTDCPNPIIKASSSQIYHLNVTDEAGCKVKTTFKVFVEKNHKIYVPTGFSPNNDGTNDLLMVYGKTGIKVLSFEIFNRWGGLVFSRSSFDVNDETAGWDGTYANDRLNTGVFTWIAKVQFPDGSIEIITGSSTLIR
jgi:gliding motility-associated-like protein